MNCPECNGKSSVIYTISDEEAVYRKRRCKKCKRMWYTSEIDSSKDAAFRHFLKYLDDKKAKDGDAQWLI